jgi:hypothetical protein
MVNIDLLINMAYGGIGALLVGVPLILVTWLWILPWAGNRWLSRAEIPDSKENLMIKRVGNTLVTSFIKDEKHMQELGSELSAYFLGQISQIVKYDEKAKQYTIPEEFKPLINGVQMLLMKQLQLQINKFSGQLKKGINNAVGNTDTGGLGAIAKMVGFDLGDGQLGQIFSLLNGLNQGAGSTGPIGGGDAGIQTI